MSREAFEAAYAAHMNESRDDGEISDAADIAKLRDGDWYGVRRSYLNGCWKGWQIARAAALEEAAEVCERIGPAMAESYGPGAECITTSDECAEAIRALKERE